MPKKHVGRLRAAAAKFSRERVGRVLVWDIETSPLLAACWSQKVDWLPIGNVLRDQFIICGAWKWLGDKKVHTASCDPDHIGAYWRGETDEMPDKDTVSTLRNMVREAEFIVAHNGDRFDLRKLNGRVIYHGLAPLPSVRTVDTLKEVRKVAQFTSHRLDYLADVLTGEGKIKTDMDLWLRVMQGQKKAMREMLTYNKRDVVALEDVYLQLRPHMKSHPNCGVDHFLAEGVQVCALCGSENIQRAGFHKTQARAYERHLCKSCGAYSRATRMDGSGVLRACQGRHP
jgi:hypothetical protein